LPPVFFARADGDSTKDADTGAADDDDAEEEAEEDWVTKAWSCGAAFVSTTASASFVVFFKVGLLSLPLSRRSCWL